ncbi:hypothetical protein J8V57_18730 [Xenorhabdus sp. PB61.4]|uniref:hypothetical protein n=1 Tax=Xenorhabdus sp. PB61.4 TaxID=2788940 RepID=UPI001E53601B|nr:hypothetical protein [Xenorhabdus sp. PB61.4]MCC8368247.1 hypothetical protein [Xenorhabdus sp. PB61.4]
MLLWRLQLSEEGRDYGHYLLVRRSRDEKQERAYYIVYARRALADLKTLLFQSHYDYSSDCSPPYRARLPTSQAAACA